MDDENHDFQNDSRFKFFSLRKTKKNSSDTQNSVFYTLRKRIQKKFTSNGQNNKVKAMEIATAESSLYSNRPNSRLEDNDFARIVIERHNQNPIQFSSPNQVVSPVVDVAEPVASNETAAQSVVTAPEEDLDTMMLRQAASLTKYGWYWGALTCNDAQMKLKTQPNGSFLVRDSQTKKYQFTLSFRSAGKTLHCRIDYIDGYWTYIERFQFDSVHELIQETMRRSQDSVFGFVKQSSRLQPPFPVRLTKPINRFYEVSTLQHLCRFIIRQKIDIPYVNSLPLPDKLKDYVKEYDDSNDNNVQDN